MTNTPPSTSSIPADDPGRALTVADPDGAGLIEAAVGRRQQQAARPERWPVSFTADQVASGADSRPWLRARCRRRRPALPGTRRRVGSSPPELGQGVPPPDST
jgi:hypothetical protein